MRNTIKTSEKIKHLSSEEIEELYEKYLNGEKNSFLVKHYKIDIKPNALITILPPRVLYDTLCKYCIIPMFAKRQSKTASSWSVPAIECYECDHKIYPESARYRNEICQCKSCINIREKETIERNMENKNKILLKHDINLVPPVEYSKLSFSHKLVLLTLFRMQTNEEFEYINPLNNNSKSEPLSPTRDMDIKYLEELYDYRILAVDPESEVNAFDEDSDFNSFYINRVKWIPNVALNEQTRASLGELYKKIYDELTSEIKLEWEDDILKNLFLISQEEILNYIHVKANELNVDFTAEVKTRDIVTQLLNSFSVSEIYYFSYKAVESAHLFYQKGFSKGKKHAANTIPNKMLSLGERAIAEEWKTYKFNRDSRAPRSWISKIFYDLFLKGEDSGFYKIPKEYWDQEIHPKYFNKKSNVEKNGLLCSKCNSDNVKIKVIDNNVEITCENCGITLKPQQ